MPSEWVATQRPGTMPGTMPGGMVSTLAGEVSRIDHEGGREDHRVQPEPGERFEVGISKRPRDIQDAVASKRIVPAVAKCQVGMAPSRIGPAPRLAGDTEDR